MNEELLKNDPASMLTVLSGSCFTSVKMFDLNVTEN